MRLTRRNLISASGVVVGSALVGLRPGFAQQVAKDPGRDRLVLLGTKGGPSLWGYTPSPVSNLLVYKGIAHVIDTGYGTAFKLIDAGLPLTAIRRVFITHHHSDHNIDLGPMLVSAWGNDLGTSVDVYGPVGLTALINGYWESNRLEIETRIADDGRVDLRKLVAAHEYSQGIVLDTPDVKVTALRNMHPPIIESFALKFEFGGKTVVFSGDTTYFPPLAAFARGADYLIHEAMYGAAIEAYVKRIGSAELLARAKASHTLAEDVGRIATAAGVKTLVLNHFIPYSVAPEKWTEAVRTTFSGTIVVGKDLLELPI
jgi:ribonuclease BN (tRNA processing enzyme)